MPRDGNEYEVGYRKPPRQTRFVKGHSGNPRGRPPGAKNLKTLLDEALNEPVTVTDTGGRRKLSKRQAIITQLVNRAAVADFRAIKMLFDILRDTEGHNEPASAEGSGFTEADEKVIAQLRARLLSRESK
jgi:hypothetical protein